MTWRIALAAFCVVGAWIVIVPARGENDTGAIVTPEDFVEVDCATIERPPLVEPAYVAAPRYALYILDNAAKVGVWVVLDKSSADAPGYDMLYFDGNANGDITEPGEKYEGTSVTIGEFAVPGSDAKHIGVGFLIAMREGQPCLRLVLQHEGREPLKGGLGMGYYTLTGAAKDSAPVLRPTVHGRFGFGIWGDCYLTRGAEAQIKLAVGNPGSGADTVMAVSDTFLQEGRDRIIVTLIAADADGKELRVETEFRERC